MAVGLVTGCGPAGTGTGVPPPAPACPYDELGVSAEGVVGALGHMGLTVRVDNLATDACELTGYPRLRLLDGGGRVMATVAEGVGYLTGTHAPVRVVSVPPGDHATFIVEWADVAVGDDPCPAGIELGITLPGAAEEVVLPAQGADGMPIAPCGASLAVSPILPPAP